MRKAFVIMQLGNKDLDEVFYNAIVPAVKECGFQEERSDISTQGDLIPKEIFQQLEESEIIIADLTNERPNCYFETGYAMGLKKNSRLFLTAKINHNLDIPGRKSSDPKVHFDVNSFPIIFWEPNNLDEFKTNLIENINNRLSRIKLGDKDYISNWDENWIEKNRLQAFSGIKTLNKKGYTELTSIVPDYSLKKDTKELYKIAKDSVVKLEKYPYNQLKRTMPTGWYVEQYDNKNLFPKPGTNNIFFELNGPSRYQYWNLRAGGAFYNLTDFFEDTNKDEGYGKYFYFDTRVRRILDSILYIANLYSNFGLPINSRILIRISHGGLKDRDLQNFHRTMHHERICHFDEPITTEFQTTIKEIREKHYELVYRVINQVVFYFENYELTLEKIKIDVNKLLQNLPVHF